MRKYTYISLFSSAGVGCYGFKQEGFNCIATCELIESRINIQKENQKCKYESGYLCGDITSLNMKNLLYKEIKLWKDKEKVDNVDVILATPPCQGMSTANYKKGNETARNSLVIEAISIIAELMPKIFIFENVSAFLKTACIDINNEIKSIGECINSNLEKDFYIFSKVINFKDYGVPSSRPRTIVIGTRKDLINISPLNIFPLKEEEITIRQAIGHLKSLSFGEIDNQDIYHFFREYPTYMEDWIRHIKEGESAFNNEEKFLPYKLEGGNKILLKCGHLGNKFRRLKWDRYCSCIATRNDQLASQDTIHPKENRVLSIRELMCLMTIPDSFIWAKNENHISNIKEKKIFLKKNELNIRRCIGEAIPTKIIRKLAHNIKIILDYSQFVDEYYKLGDTAILNCESNFYIDSFISEKFLDDVKKTGSFYTPQSVVYETLSSYKAPNKNEINILEPAVGMGAFILQLFRLVEGIPIVNIDLIDIDEKVIINLKKLFSELNFNRKQYVLNFIVCDFIKENLNKKYDLIITNPPFMTPEKDLLKEYRKICGLTKTTNSFSFFLKKYIALADEIITILPKNFLMASEYEIVRKEYEKYNIIRICDYGVKYFKDVFVEIISIHFTKTYQKKTEVISKLNQIRIFQPQSYIFHIKAWLIYRNEWFDNYFNSLKTNVFEFFRDRQITNKYLKKQGKFWVIKSKNLLNNGSIIHIEGYDRYIDEIEKFQIKKYLNTNAIIMPNFTYNTRASNLPNDCIVNGSIAILTAKYTNLNIDLELYSTENFRNYYAIVKNNAKFTLNIDKSSVFYIGVKNDK